MQKHAQFRASRAIGTSSPFVLASDSSKLVHSYVIRSSFFVFILGLGLPIRDRQHISKHDLLVIVGSRWIILLWTSFHFLIRVWPGKRFPIGYRLDRELWMYPCYLLTFESYALLNDIREIMLRSFNNPRFFFIVTFDTCFSVRWMIFDLLQRPWTCSRWWKSRFDFCLLPFFWQVQLNNRHSFLFEGLHIFLSSSGLRRYMMGFSLILFRLISVSLHI